MKKALKISAISISSILLLLVISIIPFGTYSLATFALDKTNNYELSSTLDFGVRNLSKLSSLKDFANINNCGEAVYSSLPETLENKQSIESKTAFQMTSKNLVDVNVTTNQTIAKDYSTNQDYVINALLSKSAVQLATMGFGDVSSILSGDQKIDAKINNIMTKNGDSYIKPTSIDYTNGTKTVTDKFDSFYKTPAIDSTVSSEKVIKAISSIKPKEVMSKESYIALGKYLCSGVEKVIFGALEDKNGTPVRKINIVMKKEIDAIYVKGFADIFKTIATDSVFKDFVRNKLLKISKELALMTDEEIQKYQADFDSNYDKSTNETLAGLKKTNYSGSFVEIKTIEMEINTNTLELYSQSIMTEIQIPSLATLYLNTKVSDIKYGNLETIVAPTTSESIETFGTKWTNGNIAKELEELSKKLTPADFSTESTMTSSERNYQQPNKMTPADIKEICSSNPNPEECTAQLSAL